MRKHKVRVTTRSLVRAQPQEPEQAEKSADQGPRPDCNFSPYSAKKQCADNKVQNVGTVRKGGSFIYTPVIWFEPSPSCPEGLSRQKADPFPRPYRLYDVLALLH
jgi:hypothetical protein